MRKTWFMSLFFPCSMLNNVSHSALFCFISFTSFFFSFHWWLKLYYECTLHVSFALPILNVILHIYDFEHFWLHSPASSRVCASDYVMFMNLIYFFLKMCNMGTRRKFPFPLTSFHSILLRSLAQHTLMWCTCHIYISWSLMTAFLRDSEFLPSLVNS